MTRSILDIDRLITDYNLYLTLEKGASANTREGYVRDVRRFLKWLSDGKGEASTLREVTTDVLRLYLGDLNDVGIALSTRGRIVSSLRSFFAYLEMDGYLDENPGELLESPRLGLHLPEVLTVEEIDSMIASIDYASRSVSATAP